MLRAAPTASAAVCAHVPPSARLPPAALAGGMVSVAVKYGPAVLLGMV